MPSKKYAMAGTDCVACGSCVKVCPKDALSIWRGVRATVDRTKCVGCGKCAKECPAGSIILKLREEM